MHTVSDIIVGILNVEGDEYTDDPLDSGGPTKYGITQADYSAYLGRQVAKEEIQQLDAATATKFYYDRYVVHSGFLPIINLAYDIGFEVVDSAVNCGIGTASQWLQRCLNALNKNGTLYPDLVVDGVCGQKTVNALQSYITARGIEGITVLWRYLNALQGAHYITLSENRQKDEKYVYGWGLNRLGGRP